MKNFKLEAGMVVETQLSGKKRYLLMQNDGSLFGLSINEEGKIDGGQCHFEADVFDKDVKNVWKPQFIGRWRKVLDNCNDKTLVYPSKRTINIDGKEIKISEESFQQLKKSLLE